MPRPTAPPAPRPAAGPPPPTLLRAPLDRAQIYWVQSNLDPTALIARSAGVDDGWLHWDDTNRDRARRAEGVEVGQDGVVLIHTEDGVDYTFTPLTLRLYEEHVQVHVELSPSFETTEALLAFYRTASFG